MATAGQVTKPEDIAHTQHARLSILLRAVWRARAQTEAAEIERLADELDVEMADIVVDEVFDEIGDLYAMLGEVLSGPQTSDTETEAALLLQRLRALQQAEAEAMSAEFRRRSILPEGLADRLLTRARQLLSEGSS